jgi:hypothetical protein
VDQETLDALAQSPGGQLVPISGTDQLGREYSHFAFLPAPLPAEPDLDAATWTQVARASEALGVPGHHVGHNRLVGGSPPSEL